ncbi:hypothetical protein OESDEN_22783 [Oesophagostomum dentatum]|uniref:Uncharacterized protein n=1 Tax=Oesophagostomum dentatum TaxID=61180 RepID=A0A0B1S2A7_OESDE|nr:hypothetical protein OESDEN_22783 [Oesophagostomum dentatum]
MRITWLTFVNYSDQFHRQYIKRDNTGRNFSTSRVVCCTFIS